MKPSTNPTTMPERTGNTSSMTTASLLAAITNRWCLEGFCVELPEHGDILRQRQRVVKRCGASALPRARLQAAGSGVAVSPRVCSFARRQSRGLTRNRCAILRLVMENHPMLTARASRDHGDIPAPFDRYRDVVKPEWIDHNRHMNLGFYLVVFDLATDEWFR